MLLQYYKECNALNFFKCFEVLVSKLKTLIRLIQNLSVKSMKPLSKCINQYKSKWKAAKRNIGYFNRTQEIRLNGADPQKILWKAVSVQSAEKPKKFVLH